MARRNIAETELVALRAEVDNLTDKLATIESGHAAELDQFQTKSDAMLAKLETIGAQAERIHQAQAFPSIDQAEELAKLLDLIRAAQP